MVKKKSTTGARSTKRKKQAATAELRDPAAEAKAAERPLQDAKSSGSPGTGQDKTDTAPTGFKCEDGIVELDERKTTRLPS